MRKNAIVCLLAVCFVVSLCVPALAVEGEFSDVPETHYAYTAIGALSQGENPVLRGYGDGRFGPDDPMKDVDLDLVLDRILGDGTKPWSPSEKITREVAIARIAQAYGIAPIAEPSSPFADDAKISENLRGLVYGAKERGLINGMGGNNFGPQETFTRAQVIVIIYRVDHPLTTGEMSEEFKAAVKNSTILPKGGKAPKEYPVRETDDRGMIYFGENRTYASQTVGYWDVNWVERLTQFLLDNGVKPENIAYEVRSRADLPRPSWGDPDKSRDQYPVVSVKIDNEPAAAKGYTARLDYWLGVADDGDIRYFDVILVDCYGPYYTEPEPLTFWTLGFYGWQPETLFHLKYYSPGGSKHF
jgi:hypothetical protein